MVDRLDSDYRYLHGAAGYQHCERLTPPQSPQAANEAFDITNGDVFEWRNVWPALAARRGVNTNFADESWCGRQISLAQSRRWLMMVS